MTPSNSLREYLNARYYDPKLAMFILPDWFEVTQPGVGTNRYSYSFNVPVNLNDPNGNCVWDACALETIALGGLLVGGGAIIVNGPDIDLGDLGLNGQRPLGLGERLVKGATALIRNLSSSIVKTEAVPDRLPPKQDVSGFDAAPLIAFIATKEMNYGNETHGRIPR